MGRKAGNTSKSSHHKHGKSSIATHKHVKKRVSRIAKLQRAGKQHHADTSPKYAAEREPEPAPKDESGRHYATKAQEWQAVIPGPKAAEAVTPAPRRERRRHFSLTSGKWWDLPVDEQQQRKHMYSRLCAEAEREAPDIDPDARRKLAAELVIASFEKGTL